MYAKRISSRRYILKYFPYSFDILLNFSELSANVIVLFEFQFLNKNSWNFRYNTKTILIIHHSEEVLVGIDATIL